MNIYPKSWKVILTMSTKKRVGILTFHRAYNFGSALQAYALNKFLNMCGYETKTIDFIPNKQKTIYSMPKLSFSLHAVALRLLYRLNKKATMTRFFKFDNFVKNHIVLTSKQFNENNAFEPLNEQFDAFVVGSDQIWNPRCDDFSDIYLLPFVQEKKNRIAYSPSLGSADLPREYIELFKNNLSKFNFISLREKKSCDFIRRLVNKDVVMTPDPVFLLSQSEWLEIKKDCGISRKYILCYFIGNVKGMRSFCRKIAKRNKCNIVVLNANLREYFYKNKKMFNCGPEEFLDLIKNADLVCTDSFHAAAFSLIFNKEFLAFKKDNNGTPDERLISMLNYFDLEKRIVNSDSFCLKSLEKIDFQKINMKLSKFKQTGINYLKESLI